MLEPFTTVQPSIQVSLISVSASALEKPFTCVSPGCCAVYSECENEFESDIEVISRHNSLSSTIDSHQMSISPSLRTAYFHRKSSSFRNFKMSRLSSVSSEEDLFDTEIPLMDPTHRSSINSVSVCTIESGEDHPLKFAPAPDNSFLHTKNMKEKQSSGKPEKELSVNDVTVKNRSFSFSSPFKFWKRSTSPSSPEKEIKVPQSIDPNLLLPQSENSVLSYIIRKKIRVSPYTPTNPVDTEIPLVTFSQTFEALPLFNQNLLINSPNDECILPTLLNGKYRRVREMRSNPKYLLHFSLENRAKETGLLNLSPEEIDVFDDLLLERYNEVLFQDEGKGVSTNDLFDELFIWRLKTELNSIGINKQVENNYISDLKLASLSRYKLWSSVTLNPRDDEVPNFNNITKDIYPNTSLINCRVPWLNINDVKSGKAIEKFTKAAGLLKSSNIQYISKNCSSKRWSSQPLLTL